MAILTDARVPADTGQEGWPMRIIDRIRRTGPTEKFLGEFVVKFAQPVTRASLALIFDGRRGFDRSHLTADYENIKARRIRRRVGNFLFADFRAKTVKAGRLPQNNLAFANVTEIASTRSHSEGRATAESIRADPTCPDAGCRATSATLTITIDGTPKE